MRCIIANGLLIGLDRADLRPGLRVLSVGSKAIYFASAHDGMAIACVLHSVREEGGELN